MRYCVLQQYLEPYVTWAFTEVAVPATVRSCIHISS